MLGNLQQIHPEMLADVPSEWHTALIKFISTGDGTPEFLAFLDTSEAAQSAVASALEAHLRVAGQKHLDRVDQRGGHYQAAESIAEQSGLSLEQGLNIGSLLTDIGEQLRKEQRDLDVD